MKVLTEAGLNKYHSYNSIAAYMPKIGVLANIKDMNNIAKALNEFKPDILILNEESITDVVKAYRHKNNLKIITYGTTYAECPHADITLQTHLDYPMANLDVLTYREDVEKTDISIFTDIPESSFLVEFLCQNYNVKAYGKVKINSPKYLGITTDTEKYEILNKTKYSIVFDSVDMFDSILLGAYPIVYASSGLDDIKTFDSMGALMSCMDFILDDLRHGKLIEDLLLTLQNKLSIHNNLNFVIDMLRKLGFNEELTKLSEIYKTI